jgi:hypothetical protein
MVSADRIGNKEGHVREILCGLSRLEQGCEEGHVHEILCGLSRPEQGYEEGHFSVVPY